MDCMAQTFCSFIVVGLGLTRKGRGLVKTFLKNVMMVGIQGKGKLRGANVASLSCQLSIS
jgi:hypothetical protein